MVNTSTTRRPAMVALTLFILSSHLAVVLSAPSLHKSMRMVSQMSNPLVGKQFRVDPAFQVNVDSSIESARPNESEALNRIRDTSTAVWLGSMSLVESGVSGRETAEEVLRAASEDEPEALVTFVVYNLPNRDCAAESSSGEICCSDTQDGRCNKADDSNLCEEGLSEYRNNYIDKLAASVRQYCGQVPMAFVVEPDSLPNIVTNEAEPGCGNPVTQTAYREGIKYAVETLSSSCPTAPIYMDAAHGGWLGWEEQSEKYMKEIADMGIAHLLRGFSINVSNYRVLGVQCPAVGWCNDGANPDDPCCEDDPCELSEQFNQGFTEINYAASLREIAERTIESFTPRFVVDTSRNGVNDDSISCDSWCNPRGAGLGLLPTTATINETLLDAYMWIKTPGESDGCTEELPSGERCPRFDERCASPESLGGGDEEPRAPEAGTWFDAQIKMLAVNAE